MLLNGLQRFLLECFNFFWLTKEYFIQKGNRYLSLLLDNKFFFIKIARIKFLKQWNIFIFTFWINFILNDLTLIKFTHCFFIILIYSKINLGWFVILWIKFKIMSIQFFNISFLMRNWLGKIKIFFWWNNWSFIFKWFYFRITSFIFVIMILRKMRTLLSLLLFIK